jgi:hypothetical protein
MRFRGARTERLGQLGRSSSGSPVALHGAVIFGPTSRSFPSERCDRTLRILPFSRQDRKAGCWLMDSNMLNMLRRKASQISDTSSDAKRRWGKRDIVTDYARIGPRDFRIVIHSRSGTRGQAGARCSGLRRSAARRQNAYILVDSPATFSATSTYSVNT